VDGTCGERLGRQLHDLDTGQRLAVVLESAGDADAVLAHVVLRVLKKAIEAREVLARFDALASALSNPSVLINVIPLLEAQASSEIENIVTTTDELFEATAYQSGASPAAREALRYRSALRMGFDEIGDRPITGERPHVSARRFAGMRCRFGEARCTSAILWRASESTRHQPGLRRSSGSWTTGRASSTNPRTSTRS
jgi:hypothetical protein